MTNGIIIFVKFLNKNKKDKIIIIIRDNSAVIFLEFLSIFVMDKKKF